MSAILQKDAKGHTPCGCGECDNILDFTIRVSEKVESDWIVHFVVPAHMFWDRIGYP